MSGSAKPSIVFCHGIWAGGSCFSKVIPPLQIAPLAQGLHMLCHSIRKRARHDGFVLR